MVVEPKPGTYALVLSCASNARIQTGRLGTVQLQRGYYVYLGSALGPGSLRARIAHHQKLSSRPHWHIDYLRAHTRLQSVWLNYDGTTTRARMGTCDAEAEGRNDPFPRGLVRRIAIARRTFTSSSVVLRRLASVRCACSKPLPANRSGTVQYFSQCRTSERGRLLFSGLSAG